MGEESEPAAAATIATSTRVGEEHMFGGCVRLEKEKEPSGRKKTQSRSSSVDPWMVVGAAAAAMAEECDAVTMSGTAMVMEAVEEVISWTSARELVLRRSSSAW
jgi:UDP-3-O-[3-hydroxymyristoyl] glucosamine N-acyltransferase